LRSNGFQSRKIAEAVASLRRKLHGVKHPLSELRILSDGKRIAVRVAGHKMEAVSGQIVFDFEASELGGVKDFPSRKRNTNRLRESESWFQRGLDLEENPEAAGALVNLGTIHYRQRDFAKAEQFYKRAITADPSYPLAEFNLGNLYDEQGRLAEAFDHYRRALALNPSYADAHFNLALLCERTGDPLKAVHHWRLYLKLDRTSQWAEIARRQLERLREATVIRSR
jgi:tetratricopeptide (TPR) repeat protein